jgi:mediator of RNA polymerase II transcription subunit 16
MPGNTTNSATNTPIQNGQPNNQQGLPSVPTLSPALKAAYMRIATLTASTILRIKTFETLLSTLSSHIKTAYSTHGLSGSQQAERNRNTIEIKMMLGGSIPDAFKGVIAELFRPEGLLDSVREDIDPSRLFFADFSLLEVEEDRVSIAARKRAGMTMDCFRKSWLPNPKKSDALLVNANAQDQNGGAVGGGGRQGARWRRCARCAAVMEDVLSQRQALQWLVMQQRRCFCSGYWDTLNPGETMA